MRSERGFWVILLACGPLLGCPQASPAPPGTGAHPLQRVTVARVTSQKLSKRIRVTGELQAYRSVTLHAKVQGFVERIDVDRGSAVKQGQVLAQLSAPEIAAQRAELEARLAGDESTYKRFKEASAVPGVVAGNDVDVAQRNAEAARARLQACAQQESYLRLTAPFDGIITERNAHEGSLVGPATPPIFRLQEISRLRLVSAVPEAAVGSAVAGDKANFSVIAYPGEIFAGTVSRLAQSLDVRTRTMPVELDVDNSSGRLVPGMFAEVQWEMRRLAPSFFVPVSAVATTTERSFLVRVRDGTVEWVDVRVGASLGDRVEVYGELAEGDEVAVRGTDELRPGTQVSAKEAGVK